MNAIVGFSNLMNTDIELSKAERENFTELINTNSDLLLNLINDILDLSRIESGRMSFSFQQYSLNELISTIYQTFQVLMPENVELRMQIPEKSISIPTDKFRLAQVITNFLSNAIKFTQKGYILIGYEYREEERHVHIFVEDTGIGIPKEKQDAVFNRFTKLDEFAKGTGLGLSICKVIAERFDGYIAVESEIGKGSRFSIILPLNPKHTESDQSHLFAIIPKIILLLLLYTILNFRSVSTRIKLRVQGLANSQIQSGAYALILAEENGPRRIPIIVGTAEAQSIAIALEHIVPPRPLTHDLFATFAQAFNVILKEVYIYKFEDGVFYSELEFSDGERSIKLDSRTSDAIAIALRVNCDIFTSEEIVKECGVVLEDTLSIPADEPEEDDNLLELEPDEIKDEAQLKKWLSLLDIQEINERLEDAIADENYEYAKMYKDELRRREEEEDTNK